MMLLIGISGRKGVGKNTSVEPLHRGLNAETGVSGLIEMSFAAPLKKYVRELFNLEYGALEDQDKKENAGYGRYGKTPRQLLQEVGQAMRNIAPEVWVDALLRDLAKGSSTPVVITDVRYPNEVVAIKARGGVLVRIERPSLSNHDIHASEIALNSWGGWDFTIQNDGSLHVFESRCYDVGRLIGTNWGHTLDNRSFDAVDMVED